jgi:hypothetical protein
MPRKFVCEKLGGRSILYHLKAKTLALELYGVVISPLRTTGILHVLEAPRAILIYILLDDNDEKLNWRSDIAPPLNFIVRNPYFP